MHDAGTKPSRDDAAFRAFAAKKTRQTSALARSLGLPVHAAEDLLQESLVQLWQSLDQVDQSRWEGWVWRAVSLRALMRFRTVKRARLSELDLELAETLEGHEEAQDETMHLAQCAAALQGLIDRLSPRLEEVARLHLLDDQSLAEVAAELRISKNTAKGRWRTAQSMMGAAWRRLRRPSWP